MTAARIPRTQADRARAHLSPVPATPHAAGVTPAPMPVLELHVDLDALAELVAPRVAALLADMIAAPAPERWLNAEEAAAHLCCPVSRIRALTSKAGRGEYGGIPCHHEGSRVLFKASDLDRWVTLGGGNR